MKRYNPKTIEAKWQADWSQHQLYQAVDDCKTKSKFVMLTEFPYPSGDGLHMGHVREYTIGDIIARRRRMAGDNVLYPMGYDAFGLPTENFAIKHKIAPQLATAHNIANFQKQFDALGMSIDWHRSFSTAEPSYYRWTQWLFLQFYKAGLAYRDEIAINWCPKCKTGLANEEVIAGRHERCGTIVEKKVLKQWLLRITQYADRLIDGLKTVDYPSNIADQQINWIGRSQGAEIVFQVADFNETIKVFTTRPDTLFGVTFMVVAPEHPLVKSLTSPDQRHAVGAYLKTAAAKSEVERMDMSKAKTGVFSGAYAINPINQQKVPIWIADYVLMAYGTGAIMAVPAHDSRDFEFATKFAIPIQQVVAPILIETTQLPKRNAPSAKPTMVQCIIHHPTNGSFLTIKWHKSSWQTLVTGYIDDPEKLIEGALRIIKLATGYQHIAFKRQMPLVIHGPADTDAKAINRDTTIHILEFTITDLTQTKRPSASHADFEIVWLTKTKLADLPSVGSLPFILKWLEAGDYSYSGEGILVNSAQYSGLTSNLAREKIVADLTKQGLANDKVQYKLRDWVFSRQHYWGEPIPVVYCEQCGIVPVPEDQLPVELPLVKYYEPTDNGESPLAAVTDWVKTTCPICGGPAKRETDTMPNWAGSSWYYLRYFDAHNTTAFADRRKLNYWRSVDLYLGGMEHTTLHLLYSRFWHQFLYDQGLVPTPEPYQARRGQGIILAPDGYKMSKSKGNVINPMAIIDQGYGADALRLAITFLAPYDQTTPWKPETVFGTFHFLQRVWAISQNFIDHPAKIVDSNHETAILRASNEAIKKVSGDIERFNFNTAIAALMEYTNKLYKLAAADHFQAVKAWQSAIESLLKLLAPFAPHLTEELWHDLGHQTSIHLSDWPTHDGAYLVQSTVTIVVQINGKVRGQLTMPKHTVQAVAVTAAKEQASIAKYLTADIKKIVFVQDKILNFVI